MTLRSEATNRNPLLLAVRNAPTAVSRFVDRKTALVFVAPSVIFVMVMMVLPLIFTVWLSFNRWSGGVIQSPEWIGFENYRRLITDGRFWDALRRTMWFTGFAVAIETVIGVAIAVLLNREFRAKGLVRTLFLLPMIATPVAIALVWRLMYEPNLGILNDVLAVFGLGPSEFVADSDLVMPMLVIVDVWQWTPIIILIVLAGLSALPGEVYEAAAVDGSSSWHTFWSITLPLIRPVIVVAVVFRLIDALKTFDIIWVITQGGPGFASETLNLYIFQQNFAYQNLGYSASMLVVFATIVIGLAVLMLRFRRSPL